MRMTITIVRPRLASGRPSMSGTLSGKTGLRADRRGGSIWAERPAETHEFARALIR